MDGWKVKSTTWNSFYKYVDFVSLHGIWNNCGNPYFGTKHRLIGVFFWAVEPSWPGMHSLFDRRKQTTPPGVSNKGPGTKLPPFSLGRRTPKWSLPTLLPCTTSPLSRSTKITAFSSTRTPPPARGNLHHLPFRCPVSPIFPQSDLGLGSISNLMLCESEHLELGDLIAFLHLFYVFLGLRKIYRLCWE